MLFLGGDADPAFDKVARLTAKRERKFKEAGLVAKKPRGGGFKGYHSRGAYGGNAGYQGYGYGGYQNWAGAPAALGAAPPPPPPPPQVKPPPNKALMRCNNCRELGHFFRECTKPLPYAPQ